jgi:hypothetical protein
MSEPQFKVGDYVRTKIDTNETTYRHAVKVANRILELDAINRTALVKGSETPIPLADLEMVPQLDPTARDPITGKPK